MSHTSLMKQDKTTMSGSKVSISDAAKMAGVSRATFYRHIDEKSISTILDDQGKKAVDVSELVRVYGNTLKTLEEAEKDEKDKTGRNETAQDSEMSALEKENLRDRLKFLEQERERERSQLLEQIAGLKERLDKTEEQRIRAEEQKDRLTLMLTDQRSEKEKNQVSEQKQSDQIQALQKALEEIRAQQASLFATQGQKKKWFGGLFTKKAG